VPSLPVLLAILTAFSMAAGQLLFKLGTPLWQGDTLLGWAWSFLKNPYLMTAVFLYATTIIIWVYILRSLPLSLAYPLTALSYVIVPLFSYLFLQEKIGWQTAVGSAVIVIGVIITHVRIS
jgi:drug/metabolite transporter (DMT)-like permease